MNNRKIPLNPVNGYYKEEDDVYSSRSAASDTEDMNENEISNADDSNTSRSSLYAHSIDVNDDDDED
jgi:hypothetical protein